MCLPRRVGKRLERPCLCFRAERTTESGLALLCLLTGRHERLEAAYALVNLSENVTTALADLTQYAATPLIEAAIDALLPHL
jgi:hypothetical protein